MADIIEVKKKQEVLKRIRSRSLDISEDYRRGRFKRIILLLDASGSMSGSKIEDAKKALVDFLKNINLAENETGSIAFGATNA